MRGRVIVAVLINLNENFMELFSVRNPFRIACDIVHFLNVCKKRILWDIGKNFKITKSIKLAKTPKKKSHINKKTNSNTEKKTHTDKKTRSNTQTKRHTNTQTIRRT